MRNAAPNRVHERRKVLWNLCILFGKKEYNSSTHQKIVYNTYKTFAKAYVTEGYGSPPGEEVGEELELNKHGDIEEA